MITPRSGPGFPGPLQSRLTAAYRVCLAAAVALLCACLVWRPLPGWLDFWAHAAVGRWACETGQVPRQSLFLWTASEPWADHEWLAQVAFYQLTRLAEPDDLAPVLLAFTITAVVLPFALAWYVWARRGRLASWMAIPFVLAVEGTASRFETRPELFTAVCLGVLLTYLALRSNRYDPDTPKSARRTAWEIAAVFALFVLWANLHGGVALGLLLLAVTAAGELLQQRGRRPARTLALLAALAPLAVCINPYGLAYWRAFLPVAEDQFANISEWMPVWKEPALPPHVYLAAVVPAAAALLAWSLNPARRWSQLGWLLVMGGMFALARRNVWPLAITSLVVLAANARTLDPEVLWTRLGRRFARPGRDAPPVPDILRWAVRLAILAWISLDIALLSLSLRSPARLLPTALEDGIVRLVAENRIDGRVFNDYENSSYLQWRLAGRPPLYIDLLNAYPHQVRLDYREIARATDRGRVLLDEQQIEVVILTVNRGQSGSLVRLADFLDAAPGWVRVYTGRDGAVWVRRNAKYERVWKVRAGSVRKTPFATLERFGEEGDVLLPGVRGD